MGQVFVISKNDERLISRIYKELLQSYKKKTGNGRNLVKGCEQAVHRRGNPND